VTIKKKKFSCASIQLEGIFVESSATLRQEKATPVAGVKFGHGQKPEEEVYQVETSKLAWHRLLPEQVDTTVLKIGKRQWIRCDLSDLWQDPQKLETDEDHPGKVTFLLPVRAKRQASDLRLDSQSHLGKPNSQKKARGCVQSKEDACEYQQGRRGRHPLSKKVLDRNP